MSIASIQPAYCDITVERGATIKIELQCTEDDEVTPVPLPAAYKVSGQIRTPEGEDGTNDAGTLLLALVNDQEVTITDYDNGYVELNLTSAQTIALNPNNDRKVRAVYELEFYDDSTTPITVDKFIRGNFDITSEADRS